MMCAMRIAVRPAGTPIMRKSVSRLEPMTTSGVAIGMKISRLVGSRPWKRYLPRANAIMVPRTVATSDAVMPIWRLRPTASQIPCAPQGSVHAAVENCVQV